MGRIGLISTTANTLHTRWILKKTVRGYSRLAVVPRCPDECKVSAYILQTSEDITLAFWVKVLRRSKERSRISASSVKQAQPNKIRFMRPRKLYRTTEATRQLPVIIKLGPSPTSSRITTRPPTYAVLAVDSVQFIDHTSLQHQRCPIHSVSARVRATCSRGASRVRGPPDPLTNIALTISGTVEHGPIKLSTYLINFNVGDIVDIKANAAQQKGMPHKYYHGCVTLVIKLST